MSRTTLTYAAGIIRRHRKSIGSLWRKLNPGQQALLVLAYLRKGETFAELAAGFGVSTATAWRYVTETVALLAGCWVEPIALHRPFIPALAWPMLIVVVAANALRWWCIATLGPRWTARVIVIPGLPLVRSGPYRWFAHPNYVAVVVEGAALPLVGSAWITACTFTVLNAALLTVRLRCETRALAAASPTAAGP